MFENEMINKQEIFRSPVWSYKRLYYFLTRRNKMYGADNHNRKMVYIKPDIALSCLKEYNYTFNFKNFLNIPSHKLLLNPPTNRSIIN